MEDKNNNNEEVYQSQNQLEKKGKDLAKNTTRKAAKLLKKAAKEVLSKIFAAIGWKGIAIIIGIIILILLSAFLWTVEQAVFISISDIAKVQTEDESGEIRRITEVDEENRRLKINSEAFIELVNQWFESNHVSSESIGFALKEYKTLAKFLEAEAVTSFPDLRYRSQIENNAPIEEGEIQGTVKFFRKFKDSQGVERHGYLEFMKYDDFKKEVGKFGVKVEEDDEVEQVYFEKEQVQKAYESLATYFTLDPEEYNLIIVTMSEDEKQIKYSDYAKEENNTDDNEYHFDLKVSKVDYQNYIKQYVMPFELPLGLLTVTRNAQFCEKFADMALRSKAGEPKIFEPEIVIDINDNLVETHINENYSYTSNLKLQDYLKYQFVTKSKEDGRILHEEHDIRYDPWPIEVEKNGIKVDSYKVTDTYVKTTTTQLCVSKAVNWIVDYLAVFEKSVVKEDPVIDEITEPDETQYKEVVDAHGYLKNQKFEYKLPSNKETDTQITTYSVQEEDKRILEKKTNIKTIITTNVTNTDYNKINQILNPRWSRFLTLLKYDKDFLDEKTGLPKYNVNNRLENDTLVMYEIYTFLGEDRIGSPEQNLLTGQYQLYELLASNEKTEDKVATMQDLIDIYLGKLEVTETETDFGLVQTNFENFVPEDFIPVETTAKGDYIVKTDEPGAAPIPTKDKLRAGLEKWLSGQQKTNALNVLDDVIECQNKYKVNAVFIYALMKQESSMGTASTSWVKENNWTSLTGLGHIQYASPGANIEKMCDIIANGRYYFTQGRISVYPIGERYCASPPPPAWAEKVSNYMTELYNAMGMRGSSSETPGSHNSYIEYKQGDYPNTPPKYNATGSWGSIKEKGCMPTSIAIISTGFGIKDKDGKLYTPVTFVEQVHNSGSSYANAKNAMAKIGLTLGPQTWTKGNASKMIAHLNSGQPLLIHASTGYYTGGGHYMTVLDIRNGSEVYLSNPGSRTKTGWVNINTLISRNVDWFAAVSR